MARLCAVAVAVVSLLAAAASAQWRRATSPVEQPPWGLTAPDGPQAVVLDPAAIALLESWGVGYVHADSGEAEAMLRGDGFYAATPILWGIAAGVGVDSVRPTLALRSSAFGQSERTMISLALGWAPMPSLSAGAAVRFLASGDVRLAGVTTLDLSATWRPVDWMAVSFQARDVVGPRLGGTIDQSVPRSFVLGTAFRPLSDRTVTLDLAGVIDERGAIGARTALEIGVPYVGRLMGALEAEGLQGPQADLRVTTGLAVDWESLSAGGGVHAGDGYEGAPGWFVTAGIEGAQRAGIPRSTYVLDLEVGGLGPRGLLALARSLERARTDPRIAGVLLRFRGSGIGLAYAQEIRLQLDVLRRAGKRAVCHFDDAAGSEWYACAAADRVLLDPAGGVRFSGVSSELYLLGDLLRRAGIRADFVRIGPYKSAIEEYVNASQSTPARAQREALLDAAYGRLVHDVARDLDVPAARVREIVDRGPHLPDAALELGLVDAHADDLDMGAELARGFGASYPRERGTPWEVPARWGERPRVGVVVIDGTMVDGDNVDIPLLGIHLSGGRTIASAIDSLAGDPSVVAIVVRVDSPGGSVLAADQIHRAILRARARKPVIASFGAVAASGGYYVGCAAREIWADPSTMTGSIGIWYGKIDFAPLAEMLGVHLEQMGRGARAGATSLFRPFTADERAALAEAIRTWYLAFLRRVARGRGMRVAQVDALARGRVYSGDQALELGLVDHLGGFASALTAARRAAGAGDDVDFVVVPHQPSTLLDYVLGALGLAASPAGGPTAQEQGNLLSRVAPELQAILQAVVTMRHLSAGAPMALAEDVALPR